MGVDAGIEAVSERESFGVERISFVKSVYSRDRAPSLAGLAPTLGLAPDLRPGLTNAAAFGGWITVIRSISSPNKFRSIWTSGAKAPNHFFPDAALKRRSSTVLLASLAPNMSKPRGLKPTFIRCI